MVVAFALLLMAVGSFGTEGARSATPGWAPRVVYGLNSGGRQGIYVVRLDGSRPRRVTLIEPGLNPSFSPDWAPDGTRIAFTASSPSGMDGTFTVRSNGRDRRMISEAPCYAEFDPDWSPNSQRIVYRHDTCERANIWIVNRDGSHRHRISPGRGFSPMWSPTRNLIVYSKRVFLTRDQIAVMRPDGTHERVITSGRGSEPKHSSISGNSSPRFSPGGKVIVYEGRVGDEGDEGGLSDEVCLVRVDGSHNRCLTNASGDDNQGDIAAGGRRIVFVSHRDGDPEIFTVRRDGTHERQLTKNAVADFAPSWSPNGRWIVFLSRRSGHVDVYAMRRDGSDVRRLTRSRARETEPSWAP